MAKTINKKSRRLIALLILTLGILTLISIFYIKPVKVHAEGGNKVYFSKTTIEATDSLVVAEIEASGEIGSTVKVYYHTEGVTAIQGVDYNGITNTITMKIDSSGIAKYKVSIKCLNDSNSREKLRTYSVANDETVTNYGRYFNLIIDYADNATVEENKNICKCYLPYNYKTQVVVGKQNESSIAEVAYIADYEDMLTKYHKGDEDISGKETWKTWNEGVSFNGTTTQNWVTGYINQGLAQAYSTYMFRNIDDDKVQSYSNIYLLNGNKEFMTYYERSKSCRGLGLYLEVEPCVGDDGTKLNGDAMNYIVAGDNPYKKQSILVDREEHKVVAETKRIYWQQHEKTWFANKDSYVNSTFFKNPPYNGVLDTGLAIFNNNKSWDREVHDIYLFLTLVDDTTPQIVGEYVDDSNYKIDGSIKFYVRFNEPVYRAQENLDLSVWINNSSSPLGAKYLAGEYTDTLVYVLEDAPKVNISSVKYQLPNNDIGDMAYNMDKYYKINNNMIPKSVTEKDRNMTLINGAINIITPVSTADPANSYRANNIYNLILSINDNGSKDLNLGTMYYEWSKENWEDTKDSQFLKEPSNYSKSHQFTPEENGSFNVTLVKNEEENIDNGTWYLNVLSVSDYGLKHTKTFGGYVLDGDPPELSTYEALSGLQKKEFVLEVKNKAQFDDKVDVITLYTTYVDLEGNTVTTPRIIIQGGLKTEEYKKLVSITQDENVTTYKFTSDISDTATDPDQFILDIMGERKRLEITYEFTVLDIAGNTSKSNQAKAIYDNRTLFDVKDIEVSSNITEIDEQADGLNISYKVFNIQNIDEDDYIKIEISDSIDPAIKTDLEGYSTDGDVIFSVDVNGVNIEATGGNLYVEIKNLKEGFYEIVPKIKGKAPDNATQYELVSKTIGLYLTNNKTDETVNKSKTEGNLVLLNKVCQLIDSRYYYLDSNGSNVLSHLYGAVYDDVNNKYEGGSSSPTFSSVNEAKKYVRFMEYQDLYLVKITANMASLLNTGTGSTTYVKAAGEMQAAQEGQLWIRYKKSSWTTSATPYGWAFYYYGNGSIDDGININNLSTNLNEAINTVVNRITSEREMVYLVTEETTNQRNGAPYLSSSQMHVTKEEATISKSNSKFLVNPTYAGDSNIYSNLVSVNGVNYALATNMEVTVTDSTVMYYKFNGEGTWQRLEINDGEILSSVLTTSGYYIIREYGNDGISEYGIYIDKNIPVLNVNIDEVNQDLDDSILRFSGNSFTLKSLTDTDPYGYVAIMSYPTKNLIDVLYKNDIPSGDDGYKLNNGNYYIQVGDRSGNIVTYTVLLATSTLDVTVEENESQTAVYVRVKNREENEI